MTARPLRPPAPGLSALETVLAALLTEVAIGVLLRDPAAPPLLALTLLGGPARLLALGLRLGRGGPALRVLACLGGFAVWAAAAVGTNPDGAAPILCAALAAAELHASGAAAGEAFLHDTLGLRRALTGDASRDRPAAHPR